MLFLLALHISPAVLFTMHRSSFSCAPFDIQATCDIAHLVTLCVVWAFSGILLMYTIYLCIMSRVPRPFPLVTPNELLTASSPSLSRAPSHTPSMSSLKSAMQLLNDPQLHPYSLSNGRPAASSSPSIYSQSSSVAGTVPKKLFVVNADAVSVSSDTLTRVRRGQQLRRGVSYGAMGSPAHPRPVDRASIPSAPSLFLGSSVAAPTASAIPPATFGRRPSATSATPRQMEEGNAPRTPQRSPLLGANPFKDLPSRNASPESFYSQMSMHSAPANLDMGGSYNAFSRTYDGYLTPYFSYSSNGSLVSIPPQLHPGKRLAGRLSNPSTGMPYMVSSQSSVFSYPGTPFGTPTPTPSNASVHSLVPSLHLASPHTPPDVPVDVALHPRPPYALSAPPTAHMRAGGDDPLWRPSSIRTRASSGASGASGMPYESGELPNPYGADIRRYWSMPRARSGSDSADAGYRASGHVYFAGGTGHGYAGQAPLQGALPLYTGRMAGAVGGANDPSWREMVMRAASS
ncbi:hypothetical protein LXA43DRAFT_617067 [Ganoderma leucocontextum]|nr:hypothetical protein LXA43DRAFT_617067 [Ganoderma leucocontextum]